MIFRETIQSDLEYAENHSRVQADKKQPEQTDYHYTLEHEGFPLVVGGFRFITPTTAWCYITLTDKAGSHIIEVYRVIRDWTKQFAKDHEVKRLQAYVETDFPEGERTVEHLGFEKECIMKNFLGDKDAYLYRRIF